MLKLLIWRVSDDMSFQDNALKILERQHNGIELVGVTANTETSLIYEGKNVKFIPFAEVDGGENYEILVIGAKQIGMSKITKAARQFGLLEEKLLGDWIVCIPGFTLEKYRSLQRSHLSIFSRSCFGGLISNTLGLPFRSPFVNIALSNQDFLEFLRTPHQYIEMEPHFEKMIGVSSQNKGFPRLLLGNIGLNMVHYKEIDISIKTWNERKQRINWDNLLVTTYTDDEKILEQFDALPYSKKVCFVSFKSDLGSAFYLNQKLYRYVPIGKIQGFEGVPFYCDASSKNRITEMLTHSFGRGNAFYYDPFDMLLYGKKTPLIDM